MPTDPLNPNNNHAFSRPNPYGSIGNEPGKPARELIIELGKKLEAGAVSNEELVNFFNGHRLVFANSTTKQLSSWWPEQLNSYEGAFFTCVVSCSCLCGPLSDPCNQQGLGSKTSFSLKDDHGNGNL